MLAAGLEALLAAGARQAGPGEFTRRAFLNGKLDLTQAGAVVDLIDAETADAAANAAGRKGIVLTCKERLIGFYAQFGFVDEGVSVSTHGDVVWHQMRLTF